MNKSLQLKKRIKIAILILLCGSLFMACSGTSSYKKYELNEIEKSQSLYNKGELGNDIILTVPGGEIQTGNSVNVTTKISSLVTLPSNKESVYFIVDWGDNTWSYQGPGLHGVEKQSTITHSHTYTQAGEYSVSATAFSLQTDQTFKWSKEKTIKVVGETFKKQDVIANVLPISSPAYSNDLGSDKLVDNSSSYFKSAKAEEIYDEQYAGLLFDELYTLNHIEIKIPQSADVFPSNIAIEYTVDNGTSWHSLPKYYYLYDYSIGRYSPIMRFPNPQGATLSLNLDGIVANGIRIVSKMSSMNLADSDKEKCLYVEEIRAYGNLRTLFYTSMGEEFDASLNNMWTIYGTAKTEPVVLGTLSGDSTNQSPFRTGSAMIASTEWLEWTGNKFNFTNYTEVKDIYFEQLKQVTVGDDGWSDNAGYVWATADGREHLDLGNHYSLNPIFIIATRNYLLQGNALGEFDDDNNLIDFLDIQNKRGQTMRYRIEKAMDYMLNTLDGKNGLMIIKDPKNDGTPNGFSSNYWDTHRSFGYMSAYENSLFFASLLAYSDILEYENKAEEALTYKNYASKTAKVYNNVFWNNKTGRFVSSVTADGVKPDFGITILNFMASAYGVADKSKSQQIFSWVDGDRIVEGDTSQGNDIYGKFIYSARTNTLDVSSLGPPYYWYDHNGALPPTPGTFGGFGNQMQNGGTIFYTSHYDLLGRIKTLGSDNAFNRFETILNEFKKDQLRRNSYTIHGEYVEGVLGEFPESGLVPYTFINGFLGISTTTQGLKISANLPTKMQYAGISQYFYGNREYSIKVNKNLTKAKISVHSGVYYVELPANGDYVITLDNRLIKQV